MIKKFSRQFGCALHKKKKNYMNSKVPKVEETPIYLCVCWDILLNTYVIESD